jgi:hypothetical protein
MLTITKKIIFCVAMYSAFVSLCVGSEYGHLPIQSSICFIHNNHSKMNGKIVYISAIYTTDLIENSTLTGFNCKNVKFAPYDAETNVNKESMKNFDVAVRGDLSDSSLRVFYVRLIGKYIWEPHVKPNDRIYIMEVKYFKRLQSVNPWRRKENGGN